MTPRQIACEERRKKTTFKASSRLIGPCEQMVVGFCRNVGLDISNKHMGIEFYEAISIDHEAGISSQRESLISNLHLISDFC